MSRTILRDQTGLTARVISVIAFLLMSLTAFVTVHAAPDVSLRLFQNNGGRVAWYKGNKHNLIAFDAVSDQQTKDMQIYVVRPDGGEKYCVTCSSGIPRGFMGQMDWHPDGEHLVALAENGNSEHKYFNHPSWGVDNDLWVIGRDGKNAQRIWTADRKGGAALHPHFNRDGTVLMFAERIPTGNKLPRILRALGPDGENQWEGWAIHIANVDIEKQGTSILSNHRIIRPSGSGFYEPSSFTKEGKIVYSFTRLGGAYCDDVFSSRLDGSDVHNLTNRPSSWEEHGQYSPDARYLAFISSRHDPNLRFPQAKARDLATELYLQEGSGEPRQVTRMNEEKQRRTVVSRFDWSADSRQIVLQVAVLDQLENPQLWILTLP